MLSRRVDHRTDLPAPVRIDLRDVAAWFLGWILARSMLEIRGLAWAWFIHFVQDVLIFGFMATGAITPGGG